MNSPRYWPAGLLIELGRQRIVIDGGPPAAPKGRLDAWLVSDEHAELAPAIRRLARASGLGAGVRSVCAGPLKVKPRRVVHTSHRTFGYRISFEGRMIIWAPEFFQFPRWASGADLMFSDAAGWDRPILFANKTGGHASVADVAVRARAAHVRRLIFAHIGRPTIRAMDRGAVPPFGEFGHDGDVYYLNPSGRIRCLRWKESHSRSAW
jgi:hypothetical protein